MLLRMVYVKGGADNILKLLPCCLTWTGSCFGLCPTHSNEEESCSHAVDACRWFWTRGQQRPSCRRQQIATPSSACKSCRKDCAHLAVEVGAQRGQAVEVDLLQQLVGRSAVADAIALQGATNSTRRCPPTVGAHSADHPAGSPDRTLHAALGVCVCSQRCTWCTGLNHSDCTLQRT